MLVGSNRYLTVQICLLAIVLALCGAETFRKEIRNLTRQEWDDYMDAILVYKYEGRKDVMPMYDYRCLS